MQLSSYSTFSIAFITASFVPAVRADDDLLQGLFDIASSLFQLFEEHCTITQEGDHHSFSCNFGGASQPSPVASSVLNPEKVKDAIKILGLPSRGKFDKSECHKAFRKLALENHPDKNPNDAEAEGRFIQVNKARETLDC